MRTRATLIAHLTGAVGIVADRAHPRAELVAVEQQSPRTRRTPAPRRSARESRRSGPRPARRRRILQFEQRDRFALRHDHDEAAQHVVHAERRDERREAAVTTQGADARAQRHAGRERRDNAKERAQACVHDQREDPGREPHCRGKRKIDLANRHHEHERRHEAERDRQGDENRIVDRPVQEYERARGHEDRDHHDEYGERAERGPVAVDKAPERALRRARDRLRARLDRFE